MDNELINKEIENNKSTDRRGFLKNITIISAAGLVLPFCKGKESSSLPQSSTSTSAVASQTSAPVISSSSSSAVASGQKSGVMTTRAFGKTGFNVSDISFGGGGQFTPKVVAKAIDLGFNYFDTAPDYGSGVSETTLGKGFKESGASRDKFFVTTKMCDKGPYPKHLYNASVETIIERCEDSLKRLQLDYVDTLMLHAVKGTSDGRLKDDRIWEAIDKLKKQGKVRFSGVSSHGDGPEHPRECELLIDKGLVDVLLISYSRNNGSRKEIDKLLEKCKEKGVGTVGMKVARGEEKTKEGKINGIKYVLSNPNMNTMILSINTEAELETFAKISGYKLSYSEKNELYRTVSVNNGICHLNCVECHNSCPYGVEISTVLRYDMYFADYKWEKEAMIRYNNLPKKSKADKCATCSGHCRNACRYGVDIKNSLVQAHSNMTLFEA